MTKPAYDKLRHQQCARTDCPNPVIIWLGVMWDGGAQYDECLCQEHYVSKLRSWIEQQEGIMRRLG